jgi:hypothetical protein
MVLHAGCSNCGVIVPLFCAGTVWPHLTLPVAGTPMGPYCGQCGPLAPVFICMHCGVRQGLYVPGMSAPPAGLGAWSHVAPTVSANAGTGPGDLQRMVSSAAGNFLDEFASQLGNELATCMGAWC